MLKRITSVILSLIIYLTQSTTTFASSAILEQESLIEHSSTGIIFAIAIILIAAKFFHLIEKINLPPVVGELIAGIFLGNLSLIGISFFYDIHANHIIEFLSEIGVIILLFQIGLESNVSQLLKVGKEAFLVAIIGAFLPFILGTYVIGPILFSDYGSTAHLFLGASLSATSVGIAARIFKDLNKLKTQAAQIVLGAAVIDDLIGLILLAVVSSLALEGSVTMGGVGFIVFKSFAFLILSVLIGQIIAPFVGKAFAMINTGMGTKFTLAISFGLLFSALASLIGLEPIIGAFAAGLVLDPVHFKTFREPHMVEEMKEKVSFLPESKRREIGQVLSKYAHRSVEDIIEPLSLFFVPIFFVVTGMSVRLADLFNIQTILLSLVISFIAVFGKILAGLPASQGKRLVVGLAMIPRGEVGLIFASIGKGLGVVSDQLFSIIVLTVLITTVVGPVLLSNQLAKEK